MSLPSPSVSVTPSLFKSRGTSLTISSTLISRLSPSLEGPRCFASKAPQFSKSAATLALSSSVSET